MGAVHILEDDDGIVGQQVDAQFVDLHLAHVRPIRRVRRGPFLAKACVASRAGRSRGAGSRTEGASSWPSRAVSSACRTSASRPFSTLSRARRKRLRQTIRLRPSSRTSARSPFPTSACGFCKLVSTGRRIVPATVRFVDIAGLVRGASTGQGSRQCVSEPHPRDRRDRDGGALLMTTNVTHVEGASRPGTRHRNHRDRTGARGSRHDAEAHSTTRTRGARESEAALQVSTPRRTCGERWKKAGRRGRSPAGSPEARGCGRIVLADLKPAALRGQRR